MRFVKQVKAAYIALSIAFVCMGLCLLIWPGISAVTICYVLGTASVLYGVIKLFGYFSEDLYQLAFQFVVTAADHFQAVNKIDQNIIYRFKVEKF